jgi:serine kinase of HPr protein (carbohydrate metabolism regulator)
VAGVAELLHATAIAFGEHAALLRGPPGCGKSDLALRCIAIPQGLPVAGPVLLVADDQVLAKRNGAIVELQVPPSIAGLLEVRGVGLVRLPYKPKATLALVVDLVAKDCIERMPPADLAAQIAGSRVPLIRLDGLAPSAPLKVALALDRVTGGPTRYEG